MGSRCSEIMIQRRRTRAQTRLPQRLRRGPSAAAQAGPSGYDAFEPPRDLRFGWAPTIRSTSRPALNISMAGMLRTLKRAAVAGFSSILIFAIRTRPAISAASCSIAGAIIWQGPHHGAHISSKTGSGERSTSAENVASVTVTGLLELNSGVLQRPHTVPGPVRAFRAALDSSCRRRGREQLRPHA